MTDILVNVSCKFEMYIFKIAQVINENVRIALLYVLSILFIVIVYLYIPVAGFDAIIDWYLSTLRGFIYLHIVKSTSFNQIMQRIVFLVLPFDVHVTF